MNDPEGVHRRVDSLPEEPAGADDFDYEDWVKTSTWPMELAPARLLRLKEWLQAQGFAAVEIAYRAKVDKFRVVMERGAAHCCSNDDDVEDWLCRAAEACGAEPVGLIGLLTADAKVLGSFRLSLPVLGSPT